MANKNKPINENALDAPEDDEDELNNMTMRPIINNNNAKNKKSANCIPS